MERPAVSPEDARRWMTEIDEQPEAHKLAVANVVKRQRRLGKWMKVQARHLGAHRGVSAAYMMGVAGRCMELAGGRLSTCTDAQIQACAEQVAEAVDALLPPDEGLPDRLREIPWRAQPALLDLFVEDVFESPGGEEVAPGSDQDPMVLLQLFVLLWVAIEVLDMCWIPEQPAA